MDEDETTNRTKQCLVEVKRSLEKIPHTDPWIEQGLPEKIESEFGLWQKKVPKVWGKRRINVGQYSKEVVLERVNRYSARLRQCISIGTSWNLVFHLKVIASLYAALASLLRIWRSTERPLAVRRNKMAL
jgi:hypothetical protein